MAQVDRNSAQIAKVVAQPRTPLNPADGPSVLREVTGVITPAADDSANSIGRILRVPSNARVSQVLFSTGDATTAGAINLGLYRTEEDGGAVVDADLFVAALALTGGPFNNQDVTHQSGEYTHAESDNMLWEVLGLTSDPSVEYDVAYTISTTFNGASTTMALKVRYVE